MFTGIVEELGQVTATRFGQEHPRLTVASPTALDGTRAGDSIAVEGVCLTVEERTEGDFTVGLMPETLRRTALGHLRPGDPVNVERSLAANGRIGGHFVQGHVDAVGTIRDRRADGAALLIAIESPAAIARYIVEKGYIAVDGASLTVVSRTNDAFVVSLVRHTQGATTLAGKPVGAPVNLEVDILGKYVEQLVSGVVTTAASG